MRLLTIALISAALCSTWLEAQTVSITPEWLAAHGPAPYLLTAADTTYVLATDVTVDETAFIVAAKNVTFDLGGHTITYGNAAPINVLNGGFEQGNIGDTSVTGWNLSNAPSAALAANDMYLWGEKLLKLSLPNITRTGTVTNGSAVITGIDTTGLAVGRPLMYQSTADGKTVVTYAKIVSVDNAASSITVDAPAAYSTGSRSISVGESILSDPIAIPKGNREYAALVVVKGAYTSMAGVTLIDDVTGQVVPAMSQLDWDLVPYRSQDIERGYFIDAVFTPANTHPVRLRIDVMQGPGKTNPAYIDYAALTYSRDYGIFAAIDWSVPNHLASYREQYRRVDNPTIKNGAVVQGRGNAYYSAALFCERMGSTDAGLTVDRIETHIRGVDTAAIDAFGTKNISITNSKLYSTVDAIANRMHPNGSMINAAAAGGFVTIQDNEIHGSPIYGIDVRGSSGLPIGPVSITRNTIRSSTVTTEGYGIALSGLKNFDVSYNDIRADGSPGNRSSRGIFVVQTGWGTPAMTDGEIHHNYVDIRERPNHEYGTALTATALRWKASADYPGTIFQRIKIHDNTFIARTRGGPQEVQSAIGGRFGMISDNPDNVALGNIIENNVFKAIVESQDTKWWAAAFDEAFKANTSALIKNNIFESNDISLSLNSDDGRDTFDGNFISNTLRKNTTEGPARSYASIRAGYWIGRIDNVEIFDPRYENGAQAAITWEGRGAKELSMGWLLSVNVKGVGARALPGAAVKILDKENAVVYQGSTDTLGRVKDIATVVNIYRQLTESPAQITTDARGPHRIQVSHPSYITKSQSITLTASQTANVALEPKVPDTTAPKAPKNLRWARQEETSTK